ncbi:MAG: PIN domain-containing protein [Chloroflexi bacterium]|nr:PIN domain-containing protein [Chloroflexota bacterium]
MKIYLDSCALQRPLDDKTQMRIRLEAEAILSVLELCKRGEVELISSEALEFEIEKNPLGTRREYAESALGSARYRVAMNDTVELRAHTFRNFGIQPLDALHLASAEEAAADYFCTCDDRFLKRAKTIRDLKTLLVTPLELIEELNL